MPPRAAVRAQAPMVAALPACSPGAIDGNGQTVSSPRHHGGLAGRMAASSRHAVPSPRSVDASAAGMQSETRARQLPERCRRHNSLSIETLPQRWLAGKMEISRDKLAGSGQAVSSANKTNGVACAGQAVGISWTHFAPLCPIFGHRLGHDAGRPVHPWQPSQPRKAWCGLRPERHNTRFFNPGVDPV
jgi:hypothetical protein